jgi:hypothetical protein
LEVVVELLERYNDLADPIRSGNATGRQGIALMPHEPNCVIRTARPPRCSCSFRSVSELERLLVSLRDSERRVWWHTTGWFVEVEWVLREPTPRRGSRRKLVRLQLDDDGRVIPVRVPRRRPGTSERIANEGAQWIAEHWDLRDRGILVEPNLPVERVAV